MKILHSSDWHIGQRLYTNYRDEEHELFFDWLIEQINTHNIDLLIVAGDIFDVAFPSNQALKLYYQTLTRIASSHCKDIIITGGNHDSVSTLNAPKEILNFLNIHIVGGATENIEDEIIEIRENEKTQLVVCAVPFLRDSDIRKSISGESFEAKTNAIKEGITNHYMQLSELTQKYKDENIPVIATGHLYTSGASTSDSEREIYIGNLGNITSENLLFFFDYLALGHIHRPQIVGKNESIRYSGSPIPLSFSEQNDKKSVVLLRLSAKAKNIEWLEVPQFRKLISIKGNYNDVKDKLQNYESSGKLVDWAEVSIFEEVTDLSIRSDFEKFKADLKHIEILKYNISFAEELKEIHHFFDESQSIQDIDVEEVFDKMLEDLQIINKEDLKLSFKELLLMIND